MDYLEARRILALPEEGWLTDDQVKAAYRAATRQVHPDAGGSNAAAARVNEARAVLATQGGLAPPSPVLTELRRLTPADFGTFRPRVTDTVVEQVADVVRGVEDLLSNLTGSAGSPPRAAAPDPPPFESERGIFHDVGWTHDHDDTGMPYLVLSGVPDGVRVVMRAAGDRITLLGPDNSTLTIDFAGRADYRPGS